MASLHHLLCVACIRIAVTCSSSITASLSNSNIHGADLLLCTFLLLFVPTEKAPVLKRLPKGPRDGFTLENVTMETITAIPYDIVKEGLQ